MHMHVYRRSLCVHNECNNRHDRVLSLWHRNRGYSVRRVLHHGSKKYTAKVCKPKFRSHGRLGVSRYSTMTAVPDPCGQVHQV